MAYETTTTKRRMMAVAERAIRAIIGAVALAAWQADGLVPVPHGMRREPAYEIFFRITDAMLLETEDRPALQAFLQMRELEQVAVVCETFRSMSPTELSLLEAREWSKFSTHNQR